MANCILIFIQENKIAVFFHNVTDKICLFTSSTNRTNFIALGVCQQSMFDWDSPQRLTLTRRRLQVRHARLGKGIFIRNGMDYKQQSAVVEGMQALVTAMRAGTGFSPSGPDLAPDPWLTPSLNNSSHWNTSDWVI